MIFGDSGMIGGHQMVTVYTTDFHIVETDLTKKEAIAKYGEPVTWVIV